MSHEITEDRFLADVAEHQMTIIKDEGTYRHIQFKQPGTNNMRFDLITWPGYLCYTGDMGTYVFTRLTDMFEFFRTDRNYATRKGRKLSINLGYWAEKCEAKDRSDGIKEFSEEKFTAAVMSDLIDWIRSTALRTSKEERRDLWDEVINEVINADGDSGGYRKQAAAHDFYHKVNDRVGSFEFQDFFEHTLDDYTFRFVWCCYALAWGIQKYDEAKTKPSTAIANFPCGSIGEEVSE